MTGNDNSVIAVEDNELELDVTDELEEQEAAEASGDLSVETMARDLCGALPDPTSITPYQIHTVVNTLFEAFGHPKRIRPQMVYNYDRNGMIVKGLKDVKRYGADDVAAFATKFVTKHMSA
jgi:hypothetical protein